MADYVEGLYKMPQSAEAEQSVLGALLIDPGCMTDVAELIRPGDFYDTRNQAIFETCSEMFAQSRDIDFVTLLDALKVKGVFDEAGGKVYLLELAELVPTTANVRSYAKIVREKAYLRELITACRDISQNCYEGAAEAKNIMDGAEQRIYDILNGRENQSFTHVRDILIGTYERLQLLAKGGGKDLIGVPTGYSDLDRLLVGLGKSELVLIAARPGMGKTSFALNLAQNVAQKEGKTAAVFSLEMSKEQLVTRLLSSEAQVDSHKLRTGELNDQDWLRISRASSELSKAAILIDDSTGITPTEMKAKLRRVKDLGLVVIDYLQLMQSGRRYDNRVLEISEITRGLKIMAKDLNVPVVTLSQLSRGPEGRTNHRPMLSDLRDSGSIEQDADVVMFLYREEYYEPETEKHNIAECNVAKNRSGATGTIELLWHPEYTKFSSVEHYRNEP